MPYLVREYFTAVGLALGTTFFNWKPGQVVELVSLSHW